jgi:hypothetical protein
LALAKPVGVFKKFCLLGAAGSSHGPHTAGIAATHAAQVSAFDNLGDDSSPDVHKTSSPIRTLKRHGSPPPSVSSELLSFSFTFVTVSPNNSFIGTAQPPPSLDFTLEDLDRDLESCLCHVSFVLPSYFHAIVLILIDWSIS